jgi:hypothetical protein
MTQRGKIVVFAEKASQRKNCAVPGQYRAGSGKRNWHTGRNGMRERVDCVIGGGSNQESAFVSSSCYFASYTLLPCKRAVQRPIPQGT